MLPAPYRLRRRRDFDAVTRGGRGTGSRTLVLVLTRSGSAGPPRVGFVVGRGCGVAVARNRLRRRLRHLMAQRLAVLPGDGLLVVRALPAAAAAGPVRLAGDLDRCLARLVTSPHSAALS